MERNNKNVHLRTRETPEETERQKKIFNFCDLQCDHFNDRFLFTILSDMCSGNLEALKLDCRDMYRMLYRLEEVVLYKVRITEWLICAYLDYVERNPDDMVKVLNSLIRDISKEMEKADDFGLMKESDFLHTIYVYVLKKMHKMVKKPANEKKEFIKSQINIYEINEKDLNNFLSFL